MDTFSPADDESKASPIDYTNQPSYVDFDSQPKVAYDASGRVVHSANYDPEAQVISSEFKRPPY